MRRRVLILLGALLLIGVTVWAFLRFGPGSLEGNPDERSIIVSVRLAWLPGATFAGDYVAQARGFWAQEGLDVNLRPGGFEFDAIKLVAAGADTFGVTSGPQLLQARQSGVPIVAIAATIPDSPIGWVSKKSSGITTPYEFEGKKIGAQFGTHTEMTFLSLMRKLGIPLSGVQRIPVKFDPRPFIEGAVDILPVYIIDQPVDLEAQGLSLNVIDPRAYDVAFAYGNVYFTTEKTIKERPDLVKRFLRGAQAGWIDAYKDREFAVSSIVTAAPELDRKLLARKLDLTFSFINGSRTSYRGLFPLDASNMTRDAQLLSEGSDFPPNFDVVGSFDNSFLPN